MTAAEFKKKWSRNQSKESAAYQEHFNDLCRLLGHHYTLSELKLRLPDAWSLYSHRKWFHGPFGWVLANARRLPFNPCKGQLKFFTPKI